MYDAARCLLAGMPAHITYMPRHMYVRTRHSIPRLSPRPRPRFFAARCSCALALRSSLAFISKYLSIYIHISLFAPRPASQRHRRHLAWTNSRHGLRLRSAGSRAGKEKKRKELKRMEPSPRLVWIASENGFFGDEMYM